MQTKSENHETCRGVVLSHVEAVVKNCKGFEQIVTSDAKNPDISTCDNFPATVLGCLCRKHFPGLVDVKEGRWEPAWAWDRYKLGSDDEQDNKQEWVLADFWASVSQHSSIHLLYCLSLLLK